MESKLGIFAYILSLVLVGSLVFYNLAYASLNTKSADLDASVKYFER